MFSCQVHVPNETRILLETLEFKFEQAESLRYRFFRLSGQRLLPQESLELAKGLLIVARGVIQPRVAGPITC